MYEGKDRRSQLIEELRATHALQAPEQLIKKAEAEEIRAKQALQTRQTHKVWPIPRVHAPTPTITYTSTVESKFTQTF